MYSCRHARARRGCLACCTFIHTTPRLPESRVIHGVIHGVMIHLRRRLPGEPAREASVDVAELVEAKAVFDRRARPTRPTYLMRHTRPTRPSRPRWPTRIAVTLAAGSVVPLAHRTMRVLGVPCGFHPSPSFSHVPSFSILLALLRRHDNDHDGYITTRELRHALRELKLQVDTDQALKILYEFDQNEDGKLDLNEFGTLLRKRNRRRVRASFVCVNRDGCNRRVTVSSDDSAKSFGRVKPSSRHFFSSAAIVTLSTPLVGSAPLARHCARRTRRVAPRGVRLI